MLKKSKRSLKWRRRKQGCDSSLLFTRKNIRIDREIEYYDNEACAYVEVWFDAEKKFGLDLSNGDYVNMYAYITPFTGEVRVTYVIYYANGDMDDENTFHALTQTEKSLILEMVNEVSLAETGKTVDENWHELLNEA